MAIIADTVRVCPRCGVPAEAKDYCSGCGLQLETLPELPTRSQWESGSRQETHAVPAAPDAHASRSPAAAAPSIKPLLHPTESSRLALALVAASFGAAVLVLLLVLIVNAAIIGAFVVFLAVTVGALWLGQQLLRARLLGRSLKVSRETFPELQSLLDDVAATLDYHRRVDVYVVDKGGAPISMTSYLGTRLIVVEGDLADELHDPDRRPQLTFLLGRSIGALKAKHARLDLVVFLLQAVNALKYVSLFLLPWYRATMYSGDQIGMVCCASPRAALEATRRLLVGKELASELGVGNVLPQALLVQRRLLPRLVQLLAAEPHLTNRYANLICFVRRHDPEFWDRLSTSLDTEQARALDELWQRSPHRLRLAATQGFAQP